MYNEANNPFNPIGVMQGRLLPKYKGKYQAHPVGYWQSEFKIAKSLGLDCIEFILDKDLAKKNPLLTDKGNNEILEISHNSGIFVKSICADYFMVSPLCSSDSDEKKENNKILSKLIKNASKIGCENIVIPCVDNSSLNNIDKKSIFHSEIKKIIPLLNQYSIRLSLETDLNPKDFYDLVNSFNSDKICINYDTGNSASLGFNCSEELEAYGSYISDIHIKDRIYNGGPIRLGKGNVNFRSFFNALEKIDYKGPFIMQAYRDENGIEIFKKQLNFIRPYIDEFKKNIRSKKII